MKALAIGLFVPWVAFLFYQYPSYFGNWAAFLVIILLFFILLCLYKRWIPSQYSLVSILLVIFFYFTLKEKPSITPFPSLTIEGRVIAICESQKQIRITIQNQESHKRILGIYYKHKKNENTSKGEIIQGKIIKIRPTHTQIQLTIAFQNKKMIAIFYPQLREKYLNILEHIKKNDTVSLIVHPFRNNQNLIEHYHLPRYSILSLLRFNNHHFNSMGEKEIDKIFPTRLPQIGDFIQFVTKKPLQAVIFHNFPRYLFAQGIQYYGALTTVHFLSIPSYQTWQEKIKLHLRKFYQQSSNPTLYNGIFLADRKIDPTIYELFRKNAVIPFLVIGGIHINMMVTFLFVCLKFIWLIGDLSVRPRKAYQEWKQSQWNTKRISHPWLLIIIDLILLAYLSILGYPQVATRAVVSYILISFLFYINFSTTYYEALFLTSGILFIIFPYWIGDPLGIFYSLMAMLGIYLSLPIIKAITFKIKQRSLKYIADGLLFSLLISFFVLPIALYNFHYYNWMCVVMNIPLSILFVGYTIFGLLASILSFIIPAMGIFFLHLSDTCVHLIIKVLEWGTHFSFLAIYQKNAPSLILCCLFYCCLIPLLWLCQKSLQAKTLMTI